MTQEGLKSLKKLEREVHELQDKAEGLKARIQNLYRYEEAVLGWDAHMQLSYAGAAITDAGQCIADALINLQKAYDTEKEMMKFYNGLPNKEYEEHF